MEKEIKTQNSPVRNSLVTDMESFEAELQISKQDEAMLKMEQDIKGQIENSKTRIEANEDLRSRGQFHLTNKNTKMIEMNIQKGLQIALEIVQNQIGEVE